MEKEYIELPITLKITYEDIDSIVEKATEKGGSLHWIENYKYKYCNNRKVSNGGILLLYGIEDNRIYELDRHKLLIGLEQSLPYIDGAISSIDIDTADLIVQLGLWNELIYD